MGLGEILLSVLADLVEHDDCKYKMSYKHRMGLGTVGSFGYADLWNGTKFYIVTIERVQLYT